jgi:transcriptional regulator with XRE-family HTH domain
MQTRLRAVRENLQLTQAQMAAKISVSKRAWQTYEEGNSTPGGKVLLSLAELGFNVNWILAGDGPMKIEDRYKDAHIDMVKDVILGEKEAKYRREYRFKTEIKEKITSMGEGFELLYKIYASDNHVLIRAINANLQAFAGAVDDKDRATQAVSLIKEMERRISILENKLATNEREEKNQAGPKGDSGEDEQKIA